MIKKILFFAVLLLSVNSCEKFLDVNEDLDSPYTSTPNFLLPSVIANMSTSIYDHGETDAYFTQQVATLSGYHLEKDKWNYANANRIPQWRRHFHDISINAKHVVQSAQRESSTNYEAIANIIYAFSLLNTTDMFGDMPYTEALNGNPAPKYDEQSFIYDEILKILGDAIVLLENTDLKTCRKMTSQEDHLYGGDIQKWIRFAHAIKARTLLHLTPNVNTNYDAVIAEAKSALDGWNDASFKYLSGGTSLKTNQWGSSKARPDWDYRANLLDKSAPSYFMLIEALKYNEETKTITDPRQSKLMQPNDNGEYLYVYPSLGKPASLSENDFPNLYGSYVTKDDAPMYFFTIEELHFILSEAYYSKGNLGDAFSEFTEGITSNMQRAGVDFSEINAFLNGENVPHNSGELTLSDIMMQKYLALWLQGEIWTDMRRYDYSDQVYPGLKKPAYVEKKYWDRSNPNEWIERLPYDTETEEIYNKPELDRLGAYQNPDWLKKPMFWAR